MIKIDSTNNEGDKSPLAISWHQMKQPVPGFGLYLIELLGQGVPLKSVNKPNWYQDYNFLSTNWQQGHIPENNCIKHKTWRSEACTYQESSLLHVLDSGKGKYSVHNQKCNINTNPATNSLI